MIDICLLGTGGMMPLPNRFLTSLMVRYNGSSTLIDCGEATQIAIRKKGWSCRHIDNVLITHFHADHISGLPGLLLTMGNSDRVEPVTFYGPKGLERVLSAVRVMAPELPFEVVTREINDGDTLELCGLEAKVFKAFHRIPCYGYSLSLSRQGRFDVDRAKAAGIPMGFWNRLQKGETIEAEGKIFTPEMVLGAKRKGLKLTYCTDSRPVDSIKENAKGSDLFICEGMYNEDDKEENARKYRHMTMNEAAELAKAAEVKELWLTHYSPSVVRPSAGKEGVRKIFANTVFSKDGQSKELNFDEE